MNFSEKLQLLRKNKGLTQEELAEKTGVSRQAVAKWEAGQVYPDIFNLIQISNLMNVSVDYLVKDQDCAVRPAAKQDSDLEELIAFRLEANVHTYAAFQNEVDSTRISGMKTAVICITTHTSAENSLPGKKPFGTMEPLCMQ